MHVCAHVMMVDASNHSGWETFGGPCFIAKKHLLMVSLPARLSVRAPTAAALSVLSRMLPATRAATSTSRLSAGPAATTTRTSQ